MIDKIQFEPEHNSCSVPIETNQLKVIFPFKMDTSKKHIRGNCNLQEICVSDSYWENEKTLVIDIPSGELITNSDYKISIGYEMSSLFNEYGVVIPPLEWFFSTKSGCKSKKDDKDVDIQLIPSNLSELNHPIEELKVIFPEEMKRSYFISGNCTVLGICKESAYWQDSKTLIIKPEIEMRQRSRYTVMLGSRRKGLFETKSGVKISPITWQFVTDRFESNSNDLNQGSIKLNK